MDRLASLFLTLAVAVFVGSVLRFGMDPDLVVRAMKQAGATTGTTLAAGLPMGLSFSLELSPSPLPVLSLEMIQRQETIPWLLTLLVCGMLGGHVLRVLLIQWRAEQRAALRPVHLAPALSPDEAGPWAHEQVALNARAARLTEYVPIIVALLAAGAWPWASVHSPVTGFAAAALAMIAALGAVIRGQREGARIRHSVAVGLFAGWITAVAMASFVGVLTSQAGVPATLAAIVAMGLCGTMGTWVQWRLGRPISYAMGLLSALVGIAVITMNHDPIVAMAAILAIAALAVTVVRGAS